MAFTFDDGPGPYTYLALRKLSEGLLERIPDMQMTAEPDILRSNFIGGVKHMPVTFTAGKRRMAPSLASA